ncbi:MAG: hypothetical protein ATN31_09935 [Candidatus Epulonipiscioides saccharophilum]|nr:MAG: hypothetical protein ATN31_09935 [Epulopiscium sp. AS2M-Bin001]
MKTLIRHEFDLIKLMFWLTLCVLATFGLQASNIYIALKNSYLENIIWEPDIQNNLLRILTNNGAMALVIMIMVYVQFKEIKGENVSEFILSLPFTSKDILVAKIVAGLSLIMFAGIGIGIIFLVVNMAAIELIENMRMLMPSGHLFTETYTNFSIIVITIRYILEMVLIYSFLVMGQFLIKKAGLSVTFMIGGVLSILYVLIIVSHMLYVNLINPGVLPSTVEAVRKIFDAIGEIGQMIGNVYFMDTPKEYLAYSINEITYYYTVYPQKLGWATIASVSTIGLFFSISMYLVDKVGFTRIQYFTISKTWDKVIVIWCGLCCGLFQYFYTVIVIGGRFDLLDMISALIWAGLGMIIMRLIVKRSVIGGE